MVKGVSRQVIVVHSPDRKLFEQAIFILKEDAKGVTDEELMKEAIITRTMLNTIASESDENYSAYLKQADRAYQLLIKYSKGVGQDKSIRF